MLLPTGVRLHWREAGLTPGSAVSPPVVVWIHGGSVEDSSVMVPDLEPFFGRVRALFPDTRGHGLSSAPPGPYTIDDLGGDVVALLDALKIKRAHFCGISMGGLIAL